MNEKDLLEQLKRSADDVTPPESLRPEHIEKMLLKQFHKEQSAHQDEKEPVSSGKPAGTGKNLPPAYFHLPPGRTGSRLCGGDRGLLAGRTPERFPYRRASSLLPDRLRKFQDRGRNGKSGNSASGGRDPDDPAGTDRPDRVPVGYGSPGRNVPGSSGGNHRPCRQLRSRLRSSL